MAKNKTQYLAIDSDILRALTYLDIMMKSDTHYDFSKVDNPLFQKYSGYLTRLYYRMKDDSIRLLIVDAVFQESKHSANLVNFIKENCYFPNINAVNYQEKAQQARELAYAYCSPYIYQGVEHEAPMKFVFIADVNKTLPTNDCYIMAQSTIEGVSLITANGQDFIFNKRNAGTKTKHDRSKGIVQINISRGYYIITEEGNTKTSQPIHIHTLGPMIKEDSTNFDFLQPNEDKFVKADIIL